MISKRKHIGKILNHFNYSRGVEVGVRRGSFSKIILSTWSGHLVLVDSWKHLDNYIDRSNVSDESHEDNYNQTIKNLENFNERYTIVRDLSSNAASKFEDQCFDFVYIDANHCYESCLEDISVWIKKIKSGGFIGGHDYLNMVKRHGVFGVEKAVKDFFNKEPDIITKEKWPSWFMFV